MSLEKKSDNQESILNFGGKLKRNIIIVDLHIFWVGVQVPIALSLAFELPQKDGK